MKFKELVDSVLTENKFSEKNKILTFISQLLKCRKTIVKISQIKSKNRFNETVKAYSIMVMYANEKEKKYITDNFDNIYTTLDKEEYTNIVLDKEGISNVNLVCNILTYTELNTYINDIKKQQAVIDRLRAARK